MFIGHVLAFKGEDTVVDSPVMIEITDHNNTQKTTELAFDVGKTRTYVQFKVSELLTALEEYLCD